MNLVKLTDYVADGAVCLDGSPISYYIRQNVSSTGWVVFFQGTVAVMLSTTHSLTHSLAGGGWCYNMNDCYYRAQTALGSSTSYPPNMTSGGM